MAHQLALSRSVNSASWRRAHAAARNLISSAQASFIVALSTRICTAPLRPLAARTSLALAHRGSVAPQTLRLCKARASRGIKYHQNKSHRAAHKATASPLAKYRCRLHTLFASSLKHWHSFSRHERLVRPAALAKCARAAHLMCSYTLSAAWRVASRAIARAEMRHKMWRIS